MSQGMQWARLTADVDIKIRRGAWYKVLRLGPLEAVLDVNRKPTPVPRQYLRLTPQPPQAWSLVQRPSRSARLPQSWGQVYAVCPNCRERAPLLEGRPANQRCHKCNGFFAIAWDEA